MPQAEISSMPMPEPLSAMQADLVRYMSQLTEGTNELRTEIAGLVLHRWEHPTPPTSYIAEPSVCLIIQGTKRIMLGEEVHLYNAHHFRITSVDLPVVAQVLEATPEKPYLGLSLSLDQQLIAQLLVESKAALPRNRQASRGMTMGAMSFPLLDAFQRLLYLLATPEEIPIISPIIQKEILYRLLISDQGDRLHQISTAGNHSYQIARAIAWLKQHFNQSFRVDDLATYSGMSLSAFHQHFRSLTAMTPLQFQKRLRLNEARRLMFTERLDASTAAYQVGYESPSQFSREYSRLFGDSPSRDIKNLQRVGVGG